MNSGLRKIRGFSTRVYPCPEWAPIMIALIIMDWAVVIDMKAF
jgi:hypothetical protein